MKRIPIRLIPVLLAAAAAAAIVRPLAAMAADPDAAWRDKVRSIITANGLVTQTDTNATTTTTAYTPAYAGQLLIGSQGAGTNALWIAKGTTTNDWVKVAP